MIPTPPFPQPNTNINEPLPNLPIHLSYVSNNTMSIISLAQMRQSNGYGNVRNDDILGIPIGNSALKTKFLCFMYKSIYNNNKK